MIGRLFALFGFGRSETQATTPPIFAYIGLVAVAYYAAQILEAVSWVLGAYAYYLRIPGILCVLLVGHGLYRVIVHQDSHSWGGWLRRYLVP